MKSNYLSPDHNTACQMLAVTCQEGSSNAGSKPHLSHPVFSWTNLWEIESFTFSLFGIGGTNLTFKVACWSRVPVWALAAGLIASPVEWQLLKGFLNCTQVDGWLSGGQWTESFERGGKKKRSGEGRMGVGSGAGRTVTLTPKCAEKEMSGILKKLKDIKTEGSGIGGRALVVKGGAGWH